MCFIDIAALFSSMPLFPYPTSSLHKISPCSPGSRWIIFWLQKAKVCAISFQDLQPMWSQISNVTDRRTDRQTTYNHKTTLCAEVHCAVKTERMVLAKVHGCSWIWICGILLTLITVPLPRSLFLQLTKTRLFQPNMSNVWAFDQILIIFLRAKNVKCIRRIKWLKVCTLLEKNNVRKNYAVH